LSLSFWGGEDCAIDNQTTSTIIEMAIYKPTTVRQNSRGLKRVTEASIRLEKQLDPDLIPTALDHLVKLINENCGGQITSQVFDYYPNPITPPTIEFNLDLPSIMSGINIPQDVSLDILKRLGCTIRGKFITPPSLRLDITQEEDLVEEVVRFYGYNKIPINEPLTLKQLPDITPKEIYQIEELKDKLVALGYDEILSWPIISKPSNPKTVVTTQNSINSESIYLRQSMTQSLRGQLDQYTRYNLPRPQFFEIGEVFSKEGDKITEQTSLALYNQDSDQLHTDTLRCLSSENWLFQDNFAEIILDNLPKPESYIPQTINNEAIELTSQIITLDANITLPQKRDHQELIREYRSKISENILWSMDIVDIFNNKYTFRVSYYNCTDKLAKSTHLSAFGLLDQTKTTTIAIDPNTETKLLYYDDMYQTTAKAQIIDIRKVNNQNYLILDQTVFFPEGGGQPGDQGTISNSSNNLKIKVILYKDGQILHATSNNTLSIGDQIDLKIDWNRRYKYMKIHSAGHLLHEILMEVDSTLVPLKGYHHDESYLIYSGYIDPKSISQIESKLSTAITADLPIICDYTDLETLKKDARSVPQNLPLHKKLRRLKIGNFPSMADGGVQVKSTEEIGQVKITAIENTQNQCKISYQVL
jgi:Ser-tRNA(Ala) deacylase AlaX